VHPDDVAALVSGRRSTPRPAAAHRPARLAGRLTSSDPSSSLSTILSALGAALGSERLCIHLPVDADTVAAEGTVAGAG